MEKLESHQIGKMIIIHSQIYLFHSLDPVLQPRPFLGRKIDSFDEEKKNKMC